MSVTLADCITKILTGLLLISSCSVYAESQRLMNAGREPVSQPLSPEYHIGDDGSVSLRICFNWSCARRDRLVFSAQDMAEVGRQMSFCSGNTLPQRLQRIRIGVWQMELLAQKYQPLLANDKAINDQDQNVEGRTDCVDNASNTTVFLHALKDLSLLPQWTVAAPRVRDMLTIVGVHWTAVVADQNGGGSWSVDSWYRPHGHLPMIMPLADWAAGNKGWEPPFDTLNPTPHSITELCEEQRVSSIERSDPDL
jgi:hypothetical protein